MLSLYGFRFEEKDGSYYAPQTKQETFLIPFYNLKAGIVRLNEGIIKWLDKSYTRSASAASWVGGNSIQEISNSRIYPTMPSYSHDGISRRELGCARCKIARVCLTISL